MPIKIPSNLPAFNVLRDEGVMVMDDFKANRQDIRPLKIGLLLSLIHISEPTRPY